MRDTGRSFRLASITLLAMLLPLPGCGSDDSPTSPDLLQPTTPAVISAMNTAIQAEYEAERDYAEVIDTFGEVLPFTQVLAGEEQHVDAAAELFTRRGMAVPQALRDPGALPSFTSLAQACDYGVETEEAIIAMYDRLLLQTLPHDVRQVFGNLRQASLSNHLPAFHGCCACQ